MLGETTNYYEMPWFRKWSYFGSLFLFLTPVAVIVMWTGDIYRKEKDENGNLIVMEKSYKFILTSVVFGLILRAFV